MNRNLKRAVDWIADNDEGAETDPELIEGFTTVQMASDIFDADPKLVALAIATKRAESNAKAALKALSVTKKL